MESNPDRDPAGARRRAWVEVNPSALVANLRTIERAVGGDVRLIPMVKADAYGLGLREAVRALEAEGPFGYGVATVEEGLELRRLGVQRPVMVYSPVAAGSIGEAVEAGLIPTVSDLEDLGRLAALERPLDFQIEVDTGMGRAGFLAEAAGAWWPEVRGRCGAARLFGIWTHLHSADEPDLTSARGQVDEFGTVLGALGALPDGCVVHFANSAGALRLPVAYGNAVRPGIFLYGGSVGEGTPTPEEVARVLGRITLIRDVPAGATLGYGATYRAVGPERWATVSIGYGDGLRRSLSNEGSGLVRGHRVPIIGRISMDVTVVDITGLGAVTTGDVVTFVGSDGEASLALDDVAKTAGTIGYEVLTGLSPRLPRVWAEQP